MLHHIKILMIISIITGGSGSENIQRELYKIELRKKYGPTNDLRLD